MKHYLVHNAAGVIRWAGNCPDDAELPDHSDEGLVTLELEGPVPAGDWHVVAGELQAGRLDLRTLDDRKAEKWEEIKLAREAEIDSLLETPYGDFDADPVSRQNITDAVLMVKTLQELGQPSSIDFTLADNSVVALTAAEMINVGLLLGAKVQSAHSTGRALRTQLDAAETPEAVDLVVWPA